MAVWLGLAGPGQALAEGPVTITVAGHRLTVELSLTPAARSQGLSGRTGLPADGGMLFLYPRAEPHVYWMKGMKMAIDVIWVRRGIIVGLEASVRPPSGPNDQPRLLPSPGPIDAVIETSAGWAAAHGVAVGRAVVMPLGLDPAPE